MHLKYKKKALTMLTYLCYDSFVGRPTESEKKKHDND